MTSIHEEIHRCFLALPIRDKVTERALSVAQTDFEERAGERLADAFSPELAGFHLTLRFLGNLNAEQTRAAMSLEGVGSHRDPPIGLDLQLTRLAVFNDQNDGTPRVLYVAVEGEEVEVLREIQRRAEELAQDLGCAPSDFDFTPHVTLGRFSRALSAQDQADLKALLEGQPKYTLLPVGWRADTVALMESMRVLDDDGKRSVAYRTLAEAQFLDGEDC